MIEIAGDLWEAHDLGHWVAITTNPIVNAKGSLVMGRGVALEAARRFPDLPKFLAGWVNGAGGNTPTACFKHRILSFPVKYHWREEADLNLIAQSAIRLKRLAEQLEVLYPKIFPVYTVRPGCGNGRLRWEDVKPRISLILDDRFIVVERP